MPYHAKSRWRLVRYILVALWFLFTVTLTGWWVVFGLEQIDSLMLLVHSDTGKLVRQQKMLLWEGATLVLSLTLGFGALAYFMMRERREAEQVQKFLATFTHELKTPLASVRLQAEALQDELGEAGGATKLLLHRLVADTARLALQLENSLFVADASLRSGGKYPFQLEDVSLRQAIDALRPHWPSVAIECQHDALLHLDARAFESVLQNLFQNAISHGKASRVQVTAQRADSESVRVAVLNDGVPFAGNHAKLGRLFERFYSGSGSGIGLYLVRTLMRRMGGDARVVPHAAGFEVELRAPGRVVHETIVGN